ncbi:MAG TPA: Ig-like domain-containing protein [Polyangiaceae bacterium]
MTIRAHSLAAQRACGLLWVGSLAGLSVLLSASGCSKPTCDETLTCPYDEPDPDAGEPLHDGGDLPRADASDDVTETDAASDAGAASDADAATLGPRVVSISPAPGAKGVRADANIVFTFDRPMDKVKTLQAYLSTDIPATAASLSWNPDGTQLTVNPNAELAYAGGVVTSSSGAIAPRAYSLRVTTAARDLNGNALQETATSSFTTLRRLAQGLMAIKGDVARFRNNSTSSPCNTSTSGFTSDNYLGSQKYKLLVTFDISPLPAGIVEFESAGVGTDQIFVQENSYATGVVILDHVREPIPLREPHEAFNSPALRSLGVFSNNANLEYKSVNARDALEDDYAALRQYSQYRVDNTFQGAGEYAYARFDCFIRGFHLATVYLVP